MPEIGIRLRPLLAALCALAPLGALAQDCDGALRLELAAPGMIALHFERPCTPYAPVRVDYGGLVFSEETGIRGQLDLHLPALAGATEIALSSGGRDYAQALPEAAAPVAYIGLVSSDATGALPDLVAGGDLQILGFPGLAPRAAVLPVPNGEPATLQIPVTEQTCGRALAFQLRDGREAQIQPVEVTMPPCARVGERLVLPLVPVGG